MGKKCINCVFRAKGSHIPGYDFFCRKILVDFKRKRLNQFNSCPAFKEINEYDLIFPEEINNDNN